jgi:hypothetical protein
MRGGEWGIQVWGLKFTDIGKNLDAYAQVGYRSYDIGFRGR